MCGREPITLPPPPSNDFDFDSAAAFEFLRKWSSVDRLQLTAIEPDGPGIETKTFHASQSVEAIAWIENFQGKRNLYFTPNGIKCDLNRKPKKTDINVVEAVHVDVDPVKGRGIKEEQRRIERLIREFPLKPTVLNYSGGGYQAFFKLKRPLEITDPTEIERINKSIARIMGGDHCHSVDHLMRLPETVNLPGKIKREAGRTATRARIVEADWSRLYELSDFAEFVTKEPQRSDFKAVNSKPASVSFGAAPDIENLPISRRMKDLIYGVSSPDHPYPSRSEASMAVLVAMVSKNCDDELIRRIFLDIKFPIAAHVLDQSRPDAYLDKQIATARDLVLDPDVARINKRYALILVGDKALILKEDVTPEGRPTFGFIAVGSFLQWFSNQHVLLKDSEKPVQLGAHWLRHPQRRQYERIVFAPGLDVPGSLNLWRGFAVQPTPGDCSLFLDHIRQNVCKGDEDLFRWVLGWFADIVQRPASKCGTSLVLRGKEGTGKTKVGEIFGSLFGDHYLAVSDPRYVTGRFNSHMTSTLMLHCEEAFWAGDHAGESKLKDLITGTHHLIEFKGKEPIRVRNYIRLFVTGNPDWVVPVSLEGRRFAVLEISEARMRDSNYFAAIDHQMNNGGREALLQYLMDFDLGQVDLRSVPKTAALLEQKIASLTAEQGWWLDLLTKGALPWGCELANECPTERLFDSYIDHANRSGARRRSIETRLGGFLKRAVPEIRKCQAHYRGRAKTTIHGSVYEFPTLADCRRNFELLLQQEISWDGPSEWIRTDDPETDPDGNPF